MARRRRGWQLASRTIFFPPLLPFLSPPISSHGIAPLRELQHRHDLWQGLYPVTRYHLCRHPPPSMPSPAAVYAISRRLSKVTIDSSALEKLSQSKKPPSLLANEPPSNPRFLAPEELLATLVILLNKLGEGEGDDGEGVVVKIQVVATKRRMVEPKRRERRGRRGHRGRSGQRR